MFMEMNAKEMGNGALPGSMAHGEGWGSIPPERSTEGRHGGGTPERVPRKTPLLREKGREKLNGVWGEPPRTPSVLTSLEAAVVPLTGSGSTAGSRAIIQV